MTTSNNRALTRAEFEEIINNPQFKGGFFAKPNIRYGASILAALASLVYLQQTETMSIAIPLLAAGIAYVVTGIIVGRTKVKYINAEIKPNNVIPRIRYWYNKYRTDIFNYEHMDTVLAGYDETNDMPSAEVYVFFHSTYLAMATKHNESLKEKDEQSRKKIATALKPKLN